MSCLGTVIEPTLLSQKIQQTNGHQKTQLLCSSGSEKTLANHIILKLLNHSKSAACPLNYDRLLITD
ncbi:hypothetical protein JHK84_047896 [Glycine max]|nr:hypothetical protein JHK86_047874 [Glycine max]KAG4943838.1 hypothetical protein JHK85_048484 [Glycine max]KAG5102927.1 hypothetical protein JHK84_047896 [Glycine max]